MDKCLTDRIITPFSRIIPRSRKEGEVYFNYAPYEIFCLKTRLMPYLIEKFGEGIFINFISLLQDPSGSISAQSGTKMTLSIQLTKSGDPIALSVNDKQEVQKQVNYILGTNKMYCLLLDWKLPMYSDNKLIDHTWIKSILVYLHVPEEMYPFYENGQIFGFFGHISNYDDAYFQVVKSMMDEITYMYKYGFIVGAQLIAKDWNLEPVSNDGLLFKPRWRDDRIENMVSFLQNRLLDEPEIIKYQNTISILPDPETKFLYDSIQGMIDLPEKLFKLNFDQTILNVPQGDETYQYEIKL